MANSLAEGFVRITYTGTNAPHHAIIPVNYAGTPVAGTMPDVTTKGGGTATVVDAIADFMAVYKAFFNGVTQFGLAEAYTVDPDTEERTFIWGWNIGDTGSSGVGRVPLSMGTLTFKTIAGGVLKLVFMEGVSNVNQKLFPPFELASAMDNMAEFITSDDSFIIGRDNAYAFAPISFTTKTSDALRKQEGI